MADDIEGMLVNSFTLGWLSDVNIYARNNQIVTELDSQDSVILLRLTKDEASKWIEGLTVAIAALDA